MNRLDWAAGAYSIGILAATIAYVWLTQVARVWIGPLELFIQMGIVNKLIVLMIGLLLGAGIIIAASARGASKSRAGLRTTMSMVAALASGLGVLGAAYCWMNIQIAIQAIGGSVRFAVTAPAYLEGVGSLLAGLVVALSVTLLHPRT